MNEPLHTIRFPGETDEYRRARDELLRAEIELRGNGEAVAAGDRVSATRYRPAGVLDHSALCRRLAAW